jgi:hypothetical protein
MFDNVCSFLGSKLGWAVTFAVATVAAYLLWFHTGHVVSALPFLLVLACPLMHVFGHGHGHTHKQGQDEQPRRRAAER